jgi:hypothetical protein
MNRNVNPRNMNPACELEDAELNGVTGGVRTGSAISHWEAVMLPNSTFKGVSILEFAVENHPNN